MAVQFIGIRANIYNNALLQQQKILDYVSEIDNLLRFMYFYEVRLL